MFCSYNIIETIENKLKNVVEKLDNEVLALKARNQEFLKKIDDITELTDTQKCNANANENSNIDITLKEFIKESTQTNLKIAKPSKVKNRSTLTTHQATSQQ